MKKKIICISAFGIFLLLFGTNVFAQYRYPFQDPGLPVEERIDNIISLLTLDEKVDCLSSNPSVPRLGIKCTGHVEGYHGLAMGGPSNWGQRHPAPTTIFPQAIGLAESWDTAVIRQVASIEGYETRYMFQNKNYRRGGLVVRSPNADLGRDPRWGRTEECYGEDPWLSGTMVVAFVKGLQGDHPKYWLTASLLKHFLANSNENGRDSTSSDFDTRLFYEYYSLPFRMGIVEGGARAYMAAYNAYNGIPCTVHPVLKEVTINEWGQNGIICTDGGGYSLLVRGHKYYPDRNKAAVACLRAGINQFLDFYRDGVYGAIANKYMTDEAIDSVIRGNFRVMIKLGLLDPPEMVPYSTIGVTDTLEPWLREENKTIVRDITRKTIVLLKNSENMLPLDKNKIKSIAVIGRRANEVLADWYSGNPPYTVTALEGIKNKAGDKVNVYYAADNTGDSAVNIASSSDVAIVCVGNHPTCDAEWENCPTPSEGKEAVDRKSIILEQEELIKQVYNANPNTIVVLISSFPYAINWTQENIPAILHMTHSSQELGNALADVLFGDYNPAGRLVQTWPKSISQLPGMMDYNIRNGRTYMYFKDEPLYPFGYGLSYTDFKYSNMKVSSGRVGKKDEITVSIDIHNTGARKGDEVVQLYASFPNSKVVRPDRELRGFRRVTIMPGETVTVDIPLKAETLAYWNSGNHAFEVEAGKVKIMLGSSSHNIRTEKTIEIVK
jgi:beta-glucosidase